MNPLKRKDNSAKARLPQIKLKTYFTALRVVRKEQTRGNEGKDSKKRTIISHMEYGGGLFFWSRDFGSFDLWYMVPHDFCMHVTYQAKKFTLLDSMLRLQ